MIFKQMAKADNPIAVTVVTYNKVYDAHKMCTLFPGSDNLNLGIYIKQFLVHFMYK